MNPNDPMPQQFQPTVWVMWCMACPMAVGLLVGVFVKAWLKWLVMIAAVGAVVLAVLSVLGAVNVQLALAVVLRIAGLIAEMVEWQVKPLLNAGPTLASAVIGLVAGVILREAWQHRARPSP